MKGLKLSKGEPNLCINEMEVGMVLQRLRKLFKFNYFIRIFRIRSGFFFFLLSKCSLIIVKSRACSQTSKCENGSEADPESRSASYRRDFKIDSLTIC